jgi:transcriptional regulator with XRE-family HTH domain
VDRSAVTTVGTIVRKRREELGISRERLAAQARVSTSLLRRLEADNHLPRADRLASIARALGVPIGDLMGGEAA